MNDDRRAKAEQHVESRRNEFVEAAEFVFADWNGTNGDVSRKASVPISVAALRRLLLAYTNWEKQLQAEVDAIHRGEVPEP